MLSYISPSEGGKKKKESGRKKRERGALGALFTQSSWATIPVFLESLQKQPHLVCAASLSITEQLYQIHSFLFY